MPTSLLLRNWYKIAWRWKWRGRKSLLRVGARTLGGRELSVKTHWGAKIMAPWDDTFFLQGICSEPFETAVVARIVSGGMTTIDVGANRGWYTLLLSRLAGPEGNVYAFEPDPVAFTALQRNISVNSFCNNVRIFQVAVSNDTCDLQFVAAKDSCVSHIAMVSTGTGVERLETLQTSSITLDEFVIQNGIDKVDFVKCDVEGAESLVLAGAVSVIKKSRPIILFELIDRNLRKYQSSADAILIFLAEHGFRCFGINPARGRLELCDRCPPQIIRNVLAVPEEIASEVETRLPIARTPGTQNYQLVS